MNAQILHRLFAYRRDGALIRRETVGNNPNAQIGCVAGCARGKGYWHIMVQGKLYPAHQLVYLWHHGGALVQIDHIKGKSNCIENLRPATVIQNAQNVGLTKRNTSGVKGVSWFKSGAKWRARCSVNGRDYSVGYFDSLDDAALAVRRFREQHHGEFANHGGV